MDDASKEKLVSAARRLDGVAADVRQISNENDAPLNLREALTHLQRAEALLLEIGTN